MTVRLSTMSNDGFYYSVNLPPATDSIAMSVDDYSFEYNILPGFNGNGDYFQFANNTSNSTLYYYNSSGSLVWSILPSGVYGAGDVWGGIHIDRTAGLLYMAVIDMGTSPYTLALCTINAAGTVTVLGANQLATNIYSGYLFNVIYTTSGACSLQLSSTNSNEFYFRWYVSTILMYECTVNKTNGSLGTANVLSNKASIPSFVYKTVNGIYVGTIKYTIVEQTDTLFTSIYNGNVIRNLQFRGRDVNFESNVGGAIVLQWEDHVILKVSSVTSYCAGDRIYNRTEFDTFIETYAEKVGLL